MTAWSHWPSTNFSLSSWASEGPAFHGDLMPPKIARLAGLGAYGACAGMIALFALVVFGTRHTATGGIMPTLSFVTWISIAVVIAALIAAHIAIAKQLMHLGKNGGPTRV